MEDVNGDVNGNGNVNIKVPFVRYGDGYNNVELIDGGWDKIESACRSAGITLGLKNPIGQIQTVVTNDGTFVWASNINGQRNWINLKDGKVNNKVNDYAEILSGVDMEAKEAKVKVDGLPINVTSQPYESINLPNVSRNGDVSFNTLNRVSGLTLVNQGIAFPGLVAAVRNP